LPGFEYEKPLILTSQGLFFWLFFYFPPHPSPLPPTKEQLGRRGDFHSALCVYSCAYVPRFMRGIQFTISPLPQAGEVKLQYEFKSFLDELNLTVK
jgi:hypothetical protein